MCESKEALLAKHLRQLAKQIDEPESTARLITQAEIIERRIGPKKYKSTCLYTCLYNGNLLGHHRIALGSSVTESVMLRPDPGARQ